MEAQSLDAADGALAHVLFEGEGVATGRLEVRALLHGHAEAAARGVATTLPGAALIAEFKGDRAAQALPIGKQGVDAQVEVLPLKIGRVFDGDVEVVYARSIGYVGFEAEGVGVGPLPVGNVFGFIQQIVRPAGAEQDEEENEEGE